MSTTEVKNAPTNEQNKPTENDNSTAKVESPNTAKNSYKGALGKEQEEGSQTVKQTETTTTEQTTTPSEASSSENATNEVRKPRGSSKSKSVNLNKPAWKNNKKKVSKEEEGEVLVDPKAWPTLEQVKSNENISTAAPKEKKKDSPRDDNKESNESKKKSANWVPLPIEVQTRRSNSGAPRRGRGGMRNGQQQQHQQQNTTQSTNQQNTSTTSSSTSGTQNHRGNWRKPGSNPRGGSMRGRGRGGYNNYAPGAVVYYPPPVEGESLKTALLYQVEYYFSVENLCKDVYLRQQMDEEGWIPLSVISNFNRIKYLTTDSNTLVETIKTSTVLEINDEKIRRKEDWKTWVIPKSSNQ